MSPCIDELAARYPGSKFVRIISTDCIPKVWAAPQGLGCMVRIPTGWVGAWVGLIPRHPSPLPSPSSAQCMLLPCACNSPSSSSPQNLAVASVPPPPPPPQFPDTNLPTLLVYHAGSCVKHLVGMGAFGGQRTVSPEREWPVWRGLERLQLGAGAGFCAVLPLRPCPRHYFCRYLHRAWSHSPFPLRHDLLSLSLRRGPAGDSLRETTRADRGSASPGQFVGARGPAPSLVPRRAATLSPHTLRAEVAIVLNGLGPVCRSSEEDGGGAEGGGAGEDMRLVKQLVQRVVAERAEGDEDSDFD